MGKSNAAVCYWFVTMLITGLALLKITQPTNEWLMVLIGFGFVCSAWFFMSGLLSVLRSAHLSLKPSSDGDKTSE